MGSKFIEQVQILMRSQQIKCAESVLGKSNYMWLCTRKTAIIWMSTKDEFLIRKALAQVTAHQEVKVMRELLTWLDENPDIHCLKIPEMCLKLLNLQANTNMLSDVNFSRIDSFRSSLRSLSSFKIKNKISPSANHLHSRRSVTFNETPTVYCINE